MPRAIFSEQNDMKKSRYTKSGAINSFSPKYQCVLLVSSLVFVLCQCVVVIENSFYSRFDITSVSCCLYVTLSLDSDSDLPTIFLQIANNFVPRQVEFSSGVKSEKKKI